MNIIHGTRSSYVRGCRCEECGAVARAYARCHYYSRRRKLLKVPSDVARQHILYLKKMGMGANAISDCGGVGPVTVRKIRDGKWHRIKQRTEQRILSVTPEGIADCALVDATFVHGLIRELLEEGWTRRDLNRELGRTGRQFPFLRQKRVRAKTQMLIEKLYRRAMTDGLERAG